MGFLPISDKIMTKAQEKELKRRESTKGRRPAIIPATEITTIEEPIITKKDIEDAITLHNQGVPEVSIEAKTGVKATDLEVLENIGKHIAPLSEKIKDILANQWYVLAEKALQEVASRDFSKLAVTQLATMAAIAQDKARALEGKPTEIIAQYTMVLDRLMIDKDEYDRKYRTIDIN